MLSMAGNFEQTVLCVSVCVGMCVSVYVCVINVLRDADGRF